MYTFEMHNEFEGFFIIGIAVGIEQTVEHQSAQQAMGCLLHVPLFPYLG